MERKEIVDEVQELMAEQLGIKLEELGEEVSLTDKNLKMDELDAVEVVVALEEQFAIEIDEKEWEGLSTVKDVVDIVEEKVKEDEGR